MQSSILGTCEAHTTKLICAYAAADYRWEYLGDWRNLSVGEPVPELLNFYPDAHHFGLVSAWDPSSIPRPEEVNRLADESLQEQLITSGYPFRAAFSSAANRSWREPGWLVVDMPAEEFDTLSRSYGQLATLYWPAHDAVRLRVDAARPADFKSNPVIDWLRG